VKSSFHLAEDWIPGRSISSSIDRAVAHARDVHDAGGDVLVIGPPMRRSRDSVAPLFIDRQFVDGFARIAHEVGAQAIRDGVRIALHTEAHSAISSRRDVDLFMLLTDPEYVFLCPDTAHLVLSGSDPVQTVLPHRDRVALAHWKDAAGRMPAGIEIEGDAIHEAHRAYMRPLGEGCVDWRRWAEFYDSTSAAAVRLIELDASPDPARDIAAAINVLEQDRRMR